MKKPSPTAANFPCKRYSNTEHGTQQHEYGENSVCIYCGKPSIVYTVTIPATVLTADSSETRKYNSTSRHAPVTAGAVL